MTHSKLPITPNNYRSFFSNMSKNEAADLLRYGKAKQGCISLAQGEGTLTTPAFICDAVGDALKSGKTFYAPASGVTELRQEIATYMARIYNQNIPLNRITVTSSGTNAVHLALLSVVESGDEVVAITPIWKNLVGITKLVGGTINEVPLTIKDGKWHLDIEQVFAACGQNTKAIMIVSPNNPTGWVMPAADIQAVLEFAREKGLWVIADEVYGRTTYNTAKAPSFLDYAKDDDRLYVINSFSKTWAMTGWRLGWLVGPRDAEDKIRDLILYENMGAANFVQYGAIAALRHGEDFITQQKLLWQKNLLMINKRLGDIDKIEMVMPESSFYTFFKIKGEADSFIVAKKLIDEVGLSLAPGGAFGNGFHQYLRLCFATDAQILDEALNRLEYFLGDI